MAPDRTRLGGAAALLFTTGASRSDKPTTTPPTTANVVDVNIVDHAAGGKSDGGQDVYTVGQTVHTGDLNVVLHTVTDPWVSGDEFDSPQPENRFVAVEVEMRNTGDETEIMSTWLGAELTDAQNRPWDVALAGYDLPQIEGEIEPGEARRGWMVYEVPADATDLRLRIKGELTSTGSSFDLG
ncbi:MAG TPA: DUF4352 domain-containing protein [Acidimicrobiales bacterium]|jgi:hypothetical protein|nr:DUF4352 domain-containing protein [Acidimicrobiales bacterium]